MLTHHRCLQRLRYLQGELPSSHSRGEPKYSINQRSASSAGLRRRVPNRRFRRPDLSGFALDASCRRSVDAMCPPWHVRRDDVSVIERLEPPRSPRPSARSSAIVPLPRAGCSWRPNSPWSGVLAA